MLFAFKACGQDRLDSLLRTWKRQRDNQNFSLDTNSVILLNDIAKEYLYNNPDSTLFFADYAYSLSVSQQFEYGKARALNNLGSAYYVKGSYDKALESFIGALELYRILGNENRVYWSYNNIGLIYIAQGKYDEAVREYDKIINSNQAQHDNALLTSGYFNAALSYDNKKNYKKAIDYLQKSIEISKKHELERMEVMGINRLGEAYLHAHDYQKAKLYYKQALDHSYENNWENSFAHAGLAGVYYENKQYDEAIQHGLQSLEYAKKLKAKWDAQKVLKILSNAYAEKDDFESAYKYHVLYKQYNDSLSSETKEKRISDLHLQQKEAENLQLLKENEINRQTIKVNKLLSLFVGFIALFMIVLAYIIYRNNKLKTALNKELQEKNADIALQKQQISEQNEILGGLNTTKDKLLSIIGHDLKSPLASIMSTLEVVRMGVFTPEQQETVFKGLHNKVITVSHMLDNLLSWASSQQMWMEVEFKRVDISATVSQVLAVANFLAKEKEIIIEHEKDQVFAYADINHVRIIAQNIIGNAIKFTRKGGKIRIFYSVNEKYIVIHVKDNGLGIDKEKLNKLFNQVGQGVSSMGTNHERGTGIGLMLVGQFVRENYGKIEIESEQGEGAEFKVYLRKYRQQSDD